MSIVRGVERYLDKMHLDYAVVSHNHTQSAFDSARAAHLPTSWVVKAVLLRDRSFQRYVLALLPANNKLKIRWVNDALGRDLMLAKESEVADQFPDCDLGAIPGFNDAYAMEVIWDEELAHRERLYFEAGTHEDLIEIDKHEFKRLYGHQPSAVISLGQGHYSEDHDDGVLSGWH